MDVHGDEDESKDISRSLGIDLENDSEIVDE